MTKPKKLSNRELQSEIKRLKKRLDYYESAHLYPPLTQSTDSSRAQPVGINGSYSCSKCGAGVFYDGRCGDGPVFLCGCNYVDDYYRGTNR